MDWKQQENSENIFSSVRQRKENLILIVHVVKIMRRLTTRKYFIIEKIRQDYN